MEKTAPSRMELAVFIKGLGRGNAFLACDCHMKNINKTPSDAGIFAAFQAFRNVRNYPVHILFQ